MLSNIDRTHVCEKDLCNGCMACVEKCAKSAITITDDLSAYNAVIDSTLCVGCGQCTAVCPQNHAPKKILPNAWHQGWALNESVRARSSSGGLATELSQSFIQHGGIVCSCLFKQGEFLFDFATATEEANRFSGSKYVKSTPKGVYKKLRDYLKSGKKVLFIGLPCQVAGAKNFIGEHELLYTIDLICHGTPSPQTLKMYLSEKHRNIEEMASVQFRKKTSFYLSDGSQSIEPSPTIQDRYTMAFLQSLCYTENCYSCTYADTARISDLTLGDSWGSTLDTEEQAKGISLILSQTEKGDFLLNLANVHLESVDVERAIANNKQLRAPSKKPQEHDLFFAALRKYNRFSKAVGKCYPKTCFRQKVKALLFKMKLM